MSAENPEQLQKHIDTLAAEKLALEKRLAILEKSNTKLKEQRKELQEELKVKEATKGITLPTIKIGETHYVFTGPRARVKKVVMTAEEAAQNEALCAELVDKKDGWLKPVEVQ